MADVGMSMEEESHSRNLVNNEEGSLWQGEIWVNIIEIRNDNPYELQKTVKQLR